MSLDPRGSRTQKLQDKLRQLEEQVRIAEQAERESSRQSENLTAAILSGKVNVNPAPLQPLVACYPAPLVEHDYPEYLRAAIEQETPIGFVNKVPRHAIYQELRNWDQSQELPRDLRSMLLSMFYPQKDQFNFDLDVPRFRRRYRLDASDPEALHPSLVYVVALAACSSAGPDLREFEKIFLERVKVESEKALATVDRLEHYMWTSVVLAWYWCQKGNFVAAHAVSTSVANWAIAARLYCISDPKKYLEAQEADPCIIGCPKDEMHLAERINLWWAIFILDKRMALVSGLPPLIQRNTKIITTVWPRSCADIESQPSLNAWGRESVNNLFLHGSSCTDVSKDSLLALRAKSGALLDAALWVRHLSKSDSDSNIFWTMQHALDNALKRVLQTFPEITDQREILQGEEGKGVNPSLVLGRSLVHSAAILLHSIDGDPVKNPLAYDQVLSASRRMAADLREMSRVSFVYSHAMFGPTWASGAEACLREVCRLTPPTSPEMEARLREYRRDLDSYIQGLTWLTSYFPSLGTFLSRLGEIVNDNESLAPSESS
ncbi:hypothetical protein DL93DRAFT_2162085 [Clavulina sp. PMI_390]|nr:hypothetical protein DL93DRAFT_2162085 [Clavulina sp. PMI_390]